MSKIKLLNDFSFGFELEGTFDSNLISREELNYQMDEFLGGKGNMQYDGSLRTSTSPQYRRFNECFEYSSPVINFTYANMNKVIKFLDKLPEWNVRINTSCGFHTHISYKGINKSDISWICMYLVASGDYKKFLKLGRTNFYTTRNEYASKDFLESAAEYFHDNNIHMMANELITNRKYRCIHIHPQGTLEWRGPRTFLNVNKHSKNVAYAKKLVEFLLTINKALNTDTINGLSRKEIDNRFSSKIDYLGFNVRNNTRLDNFIHRVLTSPTFLNHLSERSLQSYSSEIDSLKTNDTFKKNLLESLEKNKVNITNENVIFNFFKPIYNCNGQKDYGYMKFVSIDTFKEKELAKKFGNLHRLTSLFEYLLQTPNVNDEVLDYLVNLSIKDFGESYIRTFTYNAMMEMLKTNIKIIKTVVDKDWESTIGRQRAINIISYIVDTAKYDLKSLGIFDAFVNSPNKDLFLQYIGYNNNIISTSHRVLDNYIQ